jgi:hypothetical protein
MLQALFAAYFKLFFLFPWRILDLEHGGDVFLRLL